MLGMFISTSLYANSEYMGEDILKKIGGKTLKNYPTRTVRGYMSDYGRLHIKIGEKGNQTKYKGRLEANGNIKWTKGNIGKAILTLVEDGSNWKLKDNNGWETPPFNIEDGNYFGY